MKRISEFNKKKNLRERYSSLKGMSFAVYIGFMNNRFDGVDQLMQYWESEGGDAEDIEEYAMDIIEALADKAVVYNGNNSDKFDVIPTTYGYRYAKAWGGSVVFLSEKIDFNWEEIN